MTRHAPHPTALSVAALLLVTAAAPAAAQGPAWPVPPAPSGSVPEAPPAGPASPAARPDAPPVRGPTGVPPRAHASPAPDARLGVELEDVDAGDVERLGLAEEAGALVRDVADGSSADSAGLRGGTS